MKKSKDINKTILVIEDDADLLALITIELKEFGFNILSAVKVDAAFFELKNAESVDVIWLDHYLIGKKNGVDFVRELKKDKQYRSIPIFIVSCSVDDEKVLRYLDLGVQEYFCKTDHSLDEIISHIEGAVS